MKGKSYEKVEMVNNLENRIEQLEDEKKELKRKINFLERKKTFRIQDVCRKLEKKALLQKLENQISGLEDENGKLKKTIAFLVMLLKKNRSKACEDSKNDGIEELLRIVNT